MYKKQIATIIKRELLVIIYAFTVGLLFTAIVTKAYSDTTGKALTEKFIRLHIVANSNMKDDQNLKLIVRDAVMKLISQRVAEAENIDTARRIIISSLDDIKEVAAHTAKNEGYNYNVDASVKKMHFPTKAYDSFTLVAGEYEALYIEIGEAVGDNWWCVVYPPLCFVDVATSGRAISRQDTERILKQELNKNEYELVTKSDEPSVKIKFKAIEMWQRHRLAKLER